jgi:hypothetical protein
MEALILLVVIALILGGFNFIAGLMINGCSKCKSKEYDYIKINKLIYRCCKKCKHIELP